MHEKTFEEIRNLRTTAGDQPIPTLSEVLQAVNGYAGLMLEIKESGTAEHIYDAVGGFGFKGPVYYASFLHAELRRIRDSDQAALTIALLEGVPVDATAFALQAQATYAGIGMDSVSGDFVRALHDAGVGVLAWTADEPEDIALARKAGVDGIISNFPDRLKL